MRRIPTAADRLRRLLRSAATRIGDSLVPAVAVDDRAVLDGLATALAQAAAVGDATAGEAAEQQCRLVARRGTPDSRRHLLMALFRAGADLDRAARPRLAGAVASLAGARADLTLQQYLVLLLAHVADPVASAVGEDAFRNLLARLCRAAPARDAADVLRAVMRDFEPRSQGDLPPAEHDALAAAGHEIARASDLLISRLFPGDGSPSATMPIRLVDGKEVDHLSWLIHFAELPDDRREQWRRLFEACRRPPPARPTRNWIDAMRPCIAAIGPDAYRGTLLPGLAGDGAWPDIVAFGPGLARHLVWGLGLVMRPGDIAAVERAAHDRMTRPHAHAGSGRLVAACAQALALAGGDDAFAALVRLCRDSPRRGHRRQFETLLRHGARARGFDVDELIERTIPDGGFDGAGRRGFALGAWRAEMRLGDDGRAALVWHPPDGTAPRRALPAPLRARHADALVGIRDTLDATRRLLGEQRERIERLYLADRHWPIATWRERYLEQPVLAALARGLLWQVVGNGTATTFRLADGRPVDRGGRALDGLAAGDRIRLWHPLLAPADEIEAWRSWCHDTGVLQPFRQVFREACPPAAFGGDGFVPLPFALPVLSQLSFTWALEQRGWRVAEACESPDVPYEATRTLDGLGLRVAITAETRDAPSPGSPGKRGRIAARGATFSTRRGGVIDAATVPPLVVSEIMREVDLCAAGADVILDGADEAQAADPLPPLAAARRDMLARVLPRLAGDGGWRLEPRHVAVGEAGAAWRIDLATGRVGRAGDDEPMTVRPDRAGPPSGTAWVRRTMADDPLFADILATVLRLIAGGPAIPGE